MNSLEMCGHVIRIQRSYRVRQESLRGRKQVFRLLVEREFKTLIEFFKKKMLKNKKDKKVATLFKQLNMVSPYIMERVLDLYSRR